MEMSVFNERVQQATDPTTQRCVAPEGGPLPERSRREIHWEIYIQGFALARTHLSLQQESATRCHGGARF